MKIERTKNAVRNVFFGTALKCYKMLLPFLLRTVMIYQMGIGYVGLNGLFVSVLQVLNLAELGVGSAMVFSMYKPVAEDDTATVCALMRLYRLYYRVIGGVIAIAGGLLTPFVPYLVRGDIPEGINLYLLYGMNLLATVLSYWLFAYKSSVFRACQRNDIPDKIMLLTSTIQYALQLAVICIWKDYYGYVMVLLLTQALHNVLTAKASDRLYPEYTARGELPQEQVKLLHGRIRDLLTAKIGYVVVNEADTIVISAFLGLTMLGIYQNYYLILTSVSGFLTVIFQAVTAGIGNSLIVESKEKNLGDLRKLTRLIIWLSCCCSSCFLCLYQPFMELWVGKECMLQDPAVILLVVYFYVLELNQLMNTYKDAAGIWHRDRFRPLVTAGANLVMNLTTVQFLGVYGVLLSTVLSTLIIGMPWLVHHLFHEIFPAEECSGYIRLLLRCTAVTVVICIVTAAIGGLIHVEGWAGLVIRLIIGLTIPNGIFFFFNKCGIV